VIEWLGAYYIESQFCEKAIPYFERATVIQSVFCLLSSYNWRIELEFSFHPSVFDSSITHLLYNFVLF